MLKSLIFSGGLLACPGAFSQESEHIETDRPDQTECSSVIPRGTVQIETGLVREHDSNTSILFIPTTLIRVGAFSRVEFRIIAGEYFKTHTTDSAASLITEGFSPFSLGSKIYLCDEKNARPQTSLLFHLNHPNSRLSPNELSCDFRFSLSHTLSKRLDLGYNLGGEWNRQDGSFTWVYTLTTAFSFTEWMGAYIEVFGGITPRALPSHQFDAGMTFLLRKNLQLDCSGGVALNENSPDKFISAGIAWRIPK